MVDDSPRFLAAARPILEQGGVEVVGVASNPTEALQQVEKLRPDIVLVDIDLGDYSGFDLARELASVDTTRMILISTHAEADFKDLIASSPALGFIPKPQLSASAIEDLLGDTPD